MLWIFQFSLVYFLPHVHHFKPRLHHQYWQTQTVSFVMLCPFKSFTTHIVQEKRIEWISNASVFQIYLVLYLDIYFLFTHQRLNLRSQLYTGSVYRTELCLPPHRHHHLHYSSQPIHEQIGFNLWTTTAGSVAPHSFLSIERAFLFKFHKYIASSIRKSAALPAPEGGWDLSNIGKTVAAVPLVGAFPPCPLCALLWSLRIYSI